jgi:predicted GNAT family acetyltransferase
MWQVGIDVLADHRRIGLATALIGKLTNDILKRGKVPYYGTASSNIASQMVAVRAGYKPAWFCAYRGIFEGQATSPTG